MKYIAPPFSADVESSSAKLVVKADLYSLSPSKCFRSLFPINRMNFGCYASLGPTLSGQRNILRGLKGAENIKFTSSGFVVYYEESIVPLCSGNKGSVLSGNRAFATSSDQALMITAPIVWVSYRISSKGRNFTHNNFL